MVSTIAGGVIGFAVVGVTLILFKRKQRRSNIHFHNTLDRIVNSKNSDEIIAIRDAYRSSLDL